MNRRRFLSISGVGGIAAVNGCLSGTPFATAPVDLELWNETAMAHSVDVVVRTSDDDTVLEKTYDIEGVTSGSTASGTVIREAGFTRATDGSVFVVEATLDGERTAEHWFQATCVNQDIKDEFHIVIDSGESDSLEFNQSHCS